MDIERNLNNMRIKEFIMIKDEHNFPKLKQDRYYEWQGNLQYMSEIHRMLNDIFLMNKRTCEVAYVVALDHSKMPKGVCKIGHGGSDSTNVPLENLFTFLLLSGANAFVVVHNHISNIPYPSFEDKIITSRITNLSEMFAMEFLGHMIIHPTGFIMDGGQFSQTQNNEGNNTNEIEYLGNGRAATYVFGNRIEGEIEDIKKIFF